MQSGLRLILLASGSNGTLTGTAALHLQSYKISIHGYSCRESVQHTAYRGSMALTKGCERKVMPQCVHISLFFAVAVAVAVTSTVTAVASAAATFAFGMQYCVNLLLSGRT